jgi:DNA-binding NarL/FixJ family response regulator
MPKAGWSLLFPRNMLYSCPENLISADSSINMDKQRNYSLAIYDGHQLLRELIHHQLERMRFEVLFSCKSIEELMRYVDYNPPEILLVNAEYVREQRSGFISRLSPKCRLHGIIYYNCNTDEALTDSGTQENSTPVYYVAGGFRNLISLIDEINKHPVPVLQESQRSLRLLPDNPFFKIASNEKYLRILEMLRDGMAVKQIAGIMETSEHTVSTYIKRMHEETGYNNSIQLVYKAREYGVI